jgi:hypothetical protein
MGHSNQIGNFWQVEIGAISKLVQFGKRAGDAYTLCNEERPFQNFLSRSFKVSKF